MDRFKGKIIPARMMYDRSVLAGKRVLVLGSGKTSYGPPYTPL
jgi:cation diffusion facilitator CzcD-associated flavoprotein CzcO